MVRAVAVGLSLFVAGVAPLVAQRPVQGLDTLRVTVGSRVSAELPVAVRAVEVLTAADIERMPVRGIEEALARMVAVDVAARSPAQADVAVRGGSFGQVLVLVDGVRVSDAQTGHFDLDLAVPLREVERIELLRGPASAQYGANALGGVINIVTRGGETAGVADVHGRIEAGSFETRSVAAGARIDGGDLRVSASGEYRRSDGHRTGADYRIAAGQVGLEAILGDRPLRATLGFADRDFGASKFYTSPAAEFDEFESTRVVNLHVAWAAPAAATFALEPRLSLRRHDDDFVLMRDDPDFYRNVHHTWQLGGELTARFATEPARVAVGGEVYRDLLESTNLGDRGESRGALFGEVGIGRVGAAVGTAGMRVDWHSAYGSFVAPSLGGAVWLAPGLRLRASVGRALRAPTWTDRYYSDPANIGNPSLEPERAWEGEIGVDLEAGSARASLSSFVRSARSLIDWARPLGGDPSAPWQTMNVESATFRGFEVALTGVDFIDARWTARASLIAVDAEAAASYESKYALRPLTRQASVEVDRTIVAGIDVFLGAAYARRADEDGRVQFDARFSRRFGDLRISADVVNATATEYLDISRMPAAGRAIHIGLGWRRVR